MTASVSRTILDCSLAELAARRKLKDFSTDSELNNTELTEDVDVHVPKRRPYLSKSERDLAAEMPESLLKKYFKTGEFVHIPMTREERLLIEQFKKFNKNKMNGEFTDQDLISLTE